MAWERACEREAEKAPPQSLGTGRRVPIDLLRGSRDGQGCG